jgi:hypothetical protein
MLPFIEQDALYRHSSVTNTSESSLMDIPPPTLYICPSDPTPFGTQIHVPWYGGPTTLIALSNYAGNSQSLGNISASNPLASNPDVTRTGRSLDRDFPDGTSNTIIMAERYRVCGVNVTDPSLFYLGCNPTPYDAAFYWNGNDVSLLPQIAPSLAQCNGVRTQTPHGAMPVLLGDGSVRGLSPSISSATWISAVLPADGQVLGADW